MTAAEHVAMSERLATAAYELQSDWTEQERIAVCLISVTHALLAIAIELGAPHVSGDTVAVPGG